MKQEEIVIHIEWDGPYHCGSSDEGFRCVGSLHGSTDYGLYQIYGGHPVYGTAALLYIGIAAAQYFGDRIPQERHWLDNRDAGRLEIYVGRLAGSATPDSDTWDRYIHLAERLLIYAHSPPMNAQKNLGKLEPELRHVQVLNWARHRHLLPEVSGARWSSRFDEISNYHDFTDQELPDAEKGG